MTYRSRLITKEVDFSEWMTFREDMIETVPLIPPAGEHIKANLSTCNIRTSECQQQSACIQ